MQRRVAAQLAIASLAAAATLGCSESKSPTFQVTGTVKLQDGTPLEGGRVLFRPEGETVHAAKGEVKSDGSFTLSTFGIDDGAVAGTHRVMVLPPVSDDYMDAPNKTPSSSLAIDLKYQSLRTTPLEYTVEKGAENHFDITVDRLGQRRK